MTNLLKFALLILTITTSAHSQTTFSSKSTNSQSSYSSSGDGTATFNFQNIPVSEVLETFGVASSIAFDATMHNFLDSKVTCKGENIEIGEALSSLMAAAEVRVVATKNGKVLTATKANEEIVLPVKSLRDMLLERKLGQPVRLRMHHTPLDMVVRFASGMSHVDIQIDRVALQKAGINFRTLVSIDSKSDSLGLAMNKMLKPHGLVLIADDGMAVVTTAERTSIKEIR